MTQLLLDLKPAQPPSFDNFVVGENRELLARLSALASRGDFDALYLWGPSGSGKTHLLTATAHASLCRRPVLFLSAPCEASHLVAPSGGLLIIDDVNRLDESAQIALFRIFNTARLIGVGMLLSGPCAPGRLRLRPDLKSRIEQMLVYEVRTLNDEEKAAALRRHALERGLRLDDGLVNYLLSHGRRDLPSLMAVLDQLDRATLERKRQATLPLLKEILQPPLLPGQ
ncbi:MAG: DnaA regulatory inactivator Hda [Rhodocyclaceae bacterium]|nr:DnaA regulatory inactivator Hda [Rhodocyclaceae bacterium]